MARERASVASGLSLTLALPFIALGAATIKPQKQQAPTSPIVLPPLSPHKSILRDPRRDSPAFEDCPVETRALTVILDIPQAARKRLSVSFSDEA
ncbi:hypothetical protein PENTCL1PPCAC_14076 [Pristionchus entomophagus]|uniref:Uncharacterized protein n=1 Tax=Pristionchus entomophagus TaxID=358040 RepID=A0AAV5T8J6_9BILA|nr:hypothetical protein PENTCL1PPCAC_14076 [Pristionchus entomophagus]